MICTETGWLDRNIADEHVKFKKLQNYQKKRIQKMICTEIGRLDRNIVDEHVKSLKLQNYRKQLFSKWFGQKLYD